MKRTTVKFCGFQTLDDVKKALLLDIDALGFIFVPNRKRTVQETALKEIIASIPSHVMTVGVFMNPSQETLEHWLSIAPLSAIQLHGEESPAFCRKLKRAFRDLRIIKAFHMDSTLDEGMVESYLEWIDIALLDSSFAGQRGGTGKQFDWTCIPNLASVFRRAHVPFWVAGGIDPTNVTYLMKTYRPDGLDVSSGIERSGVKDARVMKDLIEKVRRVDNVC